MHAAPQCMLLCNFDAPWLVEKKLNFIPHLSLEIKYYAALFCASKEQIQPEYGI